MSVKNVVLAQRNGNGVDVVLPRTSADLTGYENADAPGVDNVAGALDELYARNPGDTSSLTGRVEALETGQAEQDEDIAALESGVADWTASKPGIVKRVETLEKLVPVPEATSDADRLLHYLSVDGWHKLSTAMFSPDLSGSDSQELGLAGIATESFDANTIITGYYHSNNWTNAPGGSGLLISVPVRNNTAPNYSIIQLFFTYVGQSSYRTLRQEVPVGTTPATDNWAEWQSINSPRPQAAEGVRHYTLPIKGVWAYYLSGLVSGQGVITEQFIGARAGGTVIRARQPQTTAISGLVWRIA